MNYDGSEIRPGCARFFVALFLFTIASAVALVAMAVAG